MSDISSNTSSDTSKESIKEPIKEPISLQSILNSLTPTNIGGRIKSAFSFKDKRDDLGPPVKGAKMVQIGGHDSTIPDMDEDGELSPRMNEEQLPPEVFWDVQKRCVELEEAYREIERMDTGSAAGRKRGETISKTLAKHIFEDEEVGSIVNYAYRSGERNAAALVLNKFIDLLDADKFYSVYELVHALLEAKLILPNTTISENKERLIAVISSFRNTERPISDICEQIIYDIEPELEVIYKSTYVTSKKRAEWFKSALANIECERQIAAQQTKNRRDKKARKAASFHTRGR